VEIATFFMYSNTMESIIAAVEKRAMERTGCHDWRALIVDGLLNVDDKKPKRLKPDPKPKFDKR